ncbi:putative transcriptional repressor [Ilyonectria robusta]|uniref:putative transcriptional repressor n=1 Tax=Ilyonectria robusta TaxID=1079257 RepID=UPI001E8EDFF2|nr:putative transcriptional repressor [Ilyonectria robusta]KAH8694767.1 putative transcriptional repressor [Ilyonectria robusta]
MQSADPDHYFQTDASQAQRERKAAKSGNKNGDPLVMKSKILAAVPDPASPLTSVFIAESAGYVRRVNLELSEPKTTYRGPKAPVTCLAVGGFGGKTVFAGSWDKDIWSWDVESSRPGLKFSGHSDFVKAVVCTTISGKAILISGGADKKILVWDTETGRRLHTLQDPSTTMLAVQHLAVDPVLSTADAIVLASASSDPNIRRWKITLDGYEQLPESFHDRPDAERLTIREHETSVYRLVYDDTSDDADLWTASADGTAKCLARSRNFVSDDSYEHGDYVRAVAVTDQWVVTAGRDEDVKVWDRSSGKLYATLVGHYEEITDLVMLRDAEGRGRKICSVGIDGTIRTWPLGKSELDDVVIKIEEAAKADAKKDEDKGESLLTAEEEAELAELMDD